MGLADHDVTRRHPVDGDVVHLARPRIATAATTARAEEPFRPDAAREDRVMATTKKTAASKPGKKKAAKKATKQARSLTAAQRNRLDDKDFAFPKERKEPLVDARHVRNAISRFDQVEDVTNVERDRAWKRIVAAAKKFGVDVSERGWRELFHGGKAPAKKSAKQAAKKTKKAGHKTTKKKANKTTKKKKASTKKAAKKKTTTKRS
jgi:hypothetical protein